MNRRILRPGTAVGAVALALVAGTLTAIVQPRPAGPQSLDTMAVSPSFDALAVPDDPSPSPSATTAPPPPPSTPVAPSLAPTPRPPVTAAPPAARPLPRTTGSPAPSSPAPAAQTGQWTHTQNGTTLELTMRPARPRAGQLVTFVLDMSRTADTQCCGVQMYFGDNQGASQELERQCAPRRDQEQTGRATFVFHHGYRRGGTYTPWIHVMATCDHNPFWFTFKPTFRVSDGPLLSNGPVFPWVSLADSVGDEAQGQWFQGGVDEHDGYASHWTWDFGDGTTLHQRNPNACHWPKDGGWVEYGASPRAAHTFPSPGTYTVTLTATSTGCDGRDAQVVSSTFQWTVHPGSPGAPPE